MDSRVLRDDMVDALEHALSDGIDERVVDAMRRVPRHEFVAERPYDNRDSEHEGTRVLAPATVARLLAALDPHEGDETLVVGAGVGYTSAVLAELVGDRHVHAVDITRRLVWEARSNLDDAGYGAVLVDCRNGADGLPEYAPFDRILVEAAAIEPPRRLVSQLADDGRLVLPLGGPEQELAAVERGSADDDERGEVAGRFGEVAFSPMLVEGEQHGRVARNRTHREDREYAERGWHARTGWEQDWVDWDEHL
jgi:protein-L-isoaspartate(D-aspartate) O-methyltransferase